MGAITQQLQNVWSRITITEAFREKSRKAAYSFLIGIVWIVGGLTALGPIDTVMTKNLKNQTYGQTYFEARDKMRAVKGADNVADIRANGASLAKWLENEGMEYVTAKKDGPQGAYALRKSVSDLKAAVEEAPAGKYDQGYQAYRIRAAAASVPSESFRRDVETPGGWIIDRMIFFGLIGFLVVGLSSWLRAVSERKTGLTRSLALLEGVPGGAIGGATIGFVTGFMTLAMFT